MRRLAAEISRFPRFRASLAAVLCAVALIATGCGGKSDGGADVPASGALPGLKVYKHSLDESPSSLDPAQASNTYANHVMAVAYDTLFSYKYLARPYQLKPELADGWPAISPDLLEYTIRIKKGVMFVDDPAFPGGVGREVTAEDFVYSIKRHFDPATRAQGAWLWQGRIVGLDEWKEAGADYSREVEGLRALDRYTIFIRLTQPYPQLLDTFTQGYAAVVPREAVEHYGREFAVHPVGSGPFRVVTYDTALIVLERNPKYRKEPVDLAAEGYDPATQGEYGLERIQGRSPPFVDRLEIHFIGESSARWNSFTKGDEVQYITVPNEQLDRILATRDPVTFTRDISDRYFGYAGIEAGFIFQTFNMSFPEFGYNPDPERERRNKALRCAIIKAYDFQARNESFYGGIAAVYPGIIPPVVPEFDPDMSRDSITRDVEGARKLLRDNGWTADNLPVLTYGTSANVLNRLMYEQFRAWLQEIGYPREKVVLKQYATFGDISRAWKESELPWVVKAWGLDYPDAENTLQLFYGPNGSPGSNDANYHDPEYDALFRQAKVMLPSPERTEIYRRLNQMVVDNCLTATGISRTRVHLWHKDVVAYPDREIVGGFFLKYVDVLDRPVTGGN